MINTLKSILNPIVLLDMCDDPRSIRFKEAARQSKVQTLFINNPPLETVAFTLDMPHKLIANPAVELQKAKEKELRESFKNFTPFLNVATPNINKRCDIVIFCREDNLYKAVIFDLKSDDRGLNKARIQLDNSEAILELFIKLIKINFHITLDHLSVYKVFGTIKPKNTTPKPTNLENKHLSRHDYKIVPISYQGHRTGSIEFYELVK